MSANNVIQADITATAAVFGVANMMVGYAIAHGPGIYTRHYIEEGGKRLDEAAQLLTEKRGKGDEYLIPAEDRIPNHVRIGDLGDERNRLNEETQSYGGSLRNWNASRVFYHDTTKIHKRAQALSGRHRNQAGMSDGELELKSKAQARQLHGYGLDNNRSEHLPPPAGGYVFPSGYGPQSPAQNSQRSAYNANSGYPPKNSPLGDYDRDYSLPNHPYGTARG